MILGTGYWVTCDQAIVCVFVGRRKGNAKCIYAATKKKERKKERLIAGYVLGRLSSIVKKNSQFQ